jgi:hypothetical protein
MRYFLLPAFLSLIFLSPGNGQSNQKPKKHEPPTALAGAKFVFVEIYEGPRPLPQVTNPDAAPDDRAARADGTYAALDPRITPEDREALGDIQAALKKWGYYTVTLNRRDADLLILVRKGRTADAYVGGRVGNNPPPGAPPNTHSPDAGIVAGASAGTNADMFWVYQLNPQGQESGILWQKNLVDGLASPSLTLFEDFKQDVTTAAAQLAKRQSTGP